MVTVEPTRLRGPGCIESWQLVAALCLAESRPENLFRRFAQRMRDRVRVTATQGVRSGRKHAETGDAIPSRRGRNGKPVRADLFTRIQREE